MDDYRVSTGWQGHHKRDKLELRLGRDATLAVIDLWGWCARNPQRRDGNLYGMDAEDIGLAAKYPGDHARFVAVLAELRLIDGQPGSYVVHDYGEEQPWVSNNPVRSISAKRSSAVRWHKAGKHSGVVIDGCPLCEESANGAGKHAKNAKDANASDASSRIANASEAQCDSHDENATRIIPQCSGSGSDPGSDPGTGSNASHPSHAPSDDITTGTTLGNALVNAGVNMPIGSFDDDTLKPYLPCTQEQVTEAVRKTKEATSGDKPRLYVLKVLKGLKDRGWSPTAPSSRANGNGASRYDVLGYHQGSDFTGVPSGIVNLDD